MALTTIEFAQKAKDGTLTVEDAIAFAENEPGVSDSAKKRIKALRSGFSKMGLETSMLYKDLKDKNTLSLFTREGSPDKSNRASNLQALEGVVRPVFSKYAITGATEEVAEGLAEAMYPVLTGAGTAAGTQRTGLAGERPMQGLLPQEDFINIYDEALPEIQTKYGSATADLIAYHARTANRPEQLQGLKKSDVKISGNTITVVEKKVTKTDKKGRPELSFDLDSPMGQLLKRNLDSTKSEFLFDVTDQQFTDAFNNHVGTRLEAFSDVLPLADVKVTDPDGTVRITQKPVTTPSAVRSIVPKFMLDQHNVPDGLVQGIMGHVNKTILRKNYAGIIPATDLPKLLESPQTFAVGDFGTTPNNINIDLLSDEDKAKLAEEQKLTLIEEDKRRRLEASAGIAEAQARETQALAAMTPEDIEKAARNKAALDEEKIRADVRDRIAKKAIQDDEKRKAQAKLDPAGGNPADKMSPETVERLKKLGIWETIIKKAGKLMGPLGVVTATIAAEQTRGAVTQRAEAMGIPESLSEAAGVVAGATEYLPVTASDVAEATPDMFSMRPFERAAAEEQEVREGLETTGQYVEPSRSGDKEATPPPESFMTISP